MIAPARLIPRFGADLSQEYTLTQRITTIGREQINDVVLKDPEVSRRHARIVYEADQYVLEDLGSTNGTFIDGNRLTVPTPLTSGVTVDFAETHRFTFVGSEDDYAPTLAEFDTIQDLELETRVEYDPQAHLSTPPLVSLEKRVESGTNTGPAD